MTNRGSDPVVRALRDEISALDRGIVDSLNARIELVARLKRHKDEHGLPFFDPERERELVDRLVELNGGPLSEDGLRELYATVLDVAKREVQRGDGGAPG